MYLTYLLYSANLFFGGVTLLVLNINFLVQKQILNIGVLCDPNCFEININFLKKV